MSSFEHSRFEIYSAAQHPYKHPISDFAYNNPALGDEVTNLESALDYVFAVLYPQSKAAVANQAALPLVGNTINDMRVVSDDGDGKAASYRWEQREGEVSASWHKIYDVDFGTDSILQAWQLKTQDLYVVRYGYDDRDASGNVIATDLAGQSIYGGASANTNLTLFANSGDGTGAATGFIQFGDQLRPLVNNTYDLGTTARKFKDGWFAGLLHTGTLLLGAGSITDSSGAISFDNENLSTTGQITVGTLILAAGSITDTSGTISFDNENLTTTGTVTGHHFVGTSAASSFASGTTIGNLTLSNGSISDSGGSISFGSNNLSTTGNISATSGQVNGGNLRLSTNILASTNANGDINVTPNGTGKVNLTKDATTKNLDATGSITATVDISATSGNVNGGNLRISGNTLASTNSNGNINLTPNGSGILVWTNTLRPSVDNTYDVGATAQRVASLYLGTKISDGTNQILSGEILSLRNNLFRDAARTQAAQTGDALFYNAASGTWLASVPDTEIDHGTLSGLGDDDHTQYLLLAGRSGGQSVNGGTGASDNLTLDSTSNGTKGKILVKSVPAAFTDASFAVTWSGTDLGASANRFRHVYTAGEHFGFRVENVGSLPSASASSPGRLVFLTTDNHVYVDSGTTLLKVGDTNRFQTDTSWNGTDVTKTVTVTTANMDARNALWGLFDNSNDYDQVYATIKKTGATTVVISVGSALPAGSYRLIGLE